MIESIYLKRDICYKLWISFTPDRNNIIHMRVARANFNCKYHTNILYASFHAIDVANAILSMKSRLTASENIIINYNMCYI